MKYYQCLDFDCFPTFLELAGLKPVPELDAVSLVPILKGGSVTKPRDLYFVRREGNKIYRKLMQNDPYSPLELYNLKNDPQEKTNVATKAPKVFSEMAEALRKHIQRGGGTPWQRP